MTIFSPLLYTCFLGFVVIDYLSELMLMSNTSTGVFFRVITDVVIIVAGLS